jgi:hypothetical protein
MTRLVAFLMVATGLIAADQAPAVGSTWKLRSEKVLEGTAPSFTVGKMMKIPQVVTDPPKGRTEMPGFVAKFVVSDDGLVLTEEGQGTDAKGKMFRFVLIWDRQ